MLDVVLSFVCLFVSSSNLVYSSLVNPGTRCKETVAGGILQVLL